MSRRSGVKKPNRMEKKEKPPMVDENGVHIGHRARRRLNREMKIAEKYKKEERRERRERKLDQELDDMRCTVVLAMMLLVVIAVCFIYSKITTGDALFLNIMKDPDAGLEGYEP